MDYIPTRSQWSDEEHLLVELRAKLFPTSQAISIAAPNLWSSTFYFSSHQHCCTKSLEQYLLLLKLSALLHQIFGAVPSTSQAISIAAPNLWSSIFYFSSHQCCCTKSLEQYLLLLEPSVLLHQIFGAVSSTSQAISVAAPNLWSSIFYFSSHQHCCTKSLEQYLLLLKPSVLLHQILGAVSSTSQAISIAAPNLWSSIFYSSSHQCCCTKSLKQYLLLLEPSVLLHKICAAVPSTSRAISVAAPNLWSSTFYF